MEGLTEKDWNRLLWSISGGKCILILGPGAAVAPGSCQESGLTDGLVRSMLEQTGDQGICEAGNLSLAAQRFLQNPQCSRPDLETLVCDFYSPFQEEMTPLHLALAQLPFTLCVNATFDRFLLNAFRAVGKDPVYDYYHYHSLAHLSPLSQIDPAFLRDPRRPVVYNLYGACEDGNSLVLSENDLLEFLVKVVRREPPLPDFIRARFSDREASFLFLGFGFQRWYMRILLHVLQAHSHQHPSLAMEDAHFFSHPEREQLVVFFEREHRIQFRRLGWESFAAELKDRYYRSKPPQKTDPELPEDAPRVFLCHASPDKPLVDELGRALKARKINVWMDRQSLRGGDDWERLIPSAIRSQVDYVVVVQSPVMAARKESYFHTEIKVALDRQNKFAQGARFLVPAHLQEGCLLDELAHLQSVDLSRPDGIEQLARSILEDWSRPGRREKRP